MTSHGQRGRQPEVPSRGLVADRTVLLTGASGLLGTWLRRVAPPGVAVVPVRHRTPLAGDAGVVADLRDSHAVLAAVATVRPAVIVHAAYAHDEASIVDATQNVVDAARAAGAHLVHVSTDAVFAGDGVPRDEQASPDATWPYGRWKARAERSVVQGSASSTIVRLPLVVSLDPEDHVVARIRRGDADGRPTRWYDDEIRQPAAARDLAAALWRIVALDPANAAGPWHLPGPESLTRHEIARRIASALGLGPEAVAAGPTPRSSTRPRHIHLLDGRARSTIGWAPTPVVLHGDGPPGGRQLTAGT